MTHDSDSAARTSELIFDIGGTRLRAGRPGSSTPDLTRSTPGDPHDFTAALRAMYSAMRLRFGHPSRLRIACPGIIEGHWLRQSLYLPVQDVDIAELLGGPLPSDIIVRNDVDAIALGDPGINRTDSYFVLSSGTAVGGAYVVRGEVQTASGRSIAEIGHIPVAEGLAQCVCGGTGCLDTVLSGTRLLDRAGPDWWSRPADAGLAIAMFEAGVALGRAARTISCLLGSEYLHLVGAVFSQPDLWTGFAEERRGMGGDIPVIHSRDSWPLLARSSWAHAD